ncbi:BamA/TamA family outer membrane protein [Mangrovimonas spongiae]|uniref:Outer membrane protein/protective antigen OMA87 n=1 Tax=Mangrovimonas spongiae TaxID=2494697 RepID=A0A428JYZ2_9FLAO|nr:hypothetical protein [Mangrovimonas spongiae]RSK39333.1 hypothetical protein EJA19_10440 [Mangrovimonas spongiae]
MKTPVLNQYFFFVFCTLIWGTSYTQIKQPKDSIRTQDTLQVKEDKLQNFVEKNKNNNKFNKFLYKYLVKNPRSQEGEETTKQFRERHRSFKKMEGKIIRNIHVISQDPFGYSVLDTTQKPEKWIERAGNDLHVRTKDFILKNYLLQEEGDALDSLKIEESERLIRSQRFIRRVRIEAKTITSSSDSIDLYVYSLDAWTIVPGFSYANKKANFKLRDKNFLGLGHDFSNTYRENFETKANSFKTNYRVPNIENTYISLNIDYDVNEANQYTKGISINRNFFSPLTRWAGGIRLNQRTYSDSIPNTLEIPTQHFKTSLQDYWAAISLNLFKNTAFFGSRTSKFIVSARYFNQKYLNSPGLDLDPYNFYSDQKFLLFGVGVAQRYYVQDRFIKNYNIVEDVPIGTTLGITSGVQNKNGSNRLYVAGRAAIGNYFRLGYFGSELQYGTFYSHGKREQSLLSIKANYFTKLFSYRNWKFRNFIWSDFIFGENRIDFYGDQVTLRDEDSPGISGFNSIEPLGTKKWITNFELQSYSPYSLLGFRISPFINSSIALISKENENLFKSKLFSKIGFGIMFTNDYLVFDNFQISVAWYNSIPYEGNSIFKFNAVDNQDFQYIDYEFGKPKLIEYNSRTIN